MNRLFPVPMRGVVIGMLLVFAASVTAATIWSFRSGIMWTGICLLAVAVPITALYWYMLYVNPSRTRIIVDEGRVFVEAPPFLRATVTLDTVTRAFVTDLDTDETLNPLKKERCMAYFGYRSGMFMLPAGREAVVVSRSSRVLCLKTPDLFYILGPKDLDGLVEAVRASIPVDTGN
ncbi:hypothetical protein GGQ74_001356 [Desulfobaculum xiamenense]|uniref:Bacterial Pleckstrin homology domain-containing protein n=1 Tax=Desulfobaculum xiamenense TaxID=995050 RepID=A0A846QFZ5_9BACT|nr:PH domain-containing protein [Desulfobaculum xiamenense]NJB67716.1 hypothetical protein [Desulfobaculum xiamenense]